MESSPIIPPGYVLLGVTPIMYDPTTFDQVKAVMYRNPETGTVIKGEVIREGHWLWNYYDDETV